MRPPDRRLRGTSVLAAPLALIAVMALSLAVASGLWAAYGNEGDPTTVVASVVIPAAIGVVALAAIRGCFVEVSPDATVRDVACWITLRRIPQSHITTARVRRGVWRLYVLETDRGEAIKLVGASPLQFPSTLLSDARDHDVADLDLLLGTET